MRRLATALFACAALAALAAPASAQGAFGLKELEVRFTADPEGTPAVQAGSHPYAVETFLEVNSHEEPEGSGDFLPDGGDVKDLIIQQVRGLTGDTTAVERCTTLQFATSDAGLPACEDSTAVGFTATILQDPTGGGIPVVAPVYNLTPPPGAPVRLGFVVSEVPVVIDVAIKPAPDHNAIASIKNIPQPLTFFGSVFELWGVPADADHDFLRGRCGTEAFPDPSEPITPDGRLNYDPDFGPKCDAAGAPERPFLTLPRSCAGPLSTDWQMRPWGDPSLLASGSLPAPAFGGCSADRVPFDPEISSLATTDRAASGSGQVFELDFEDEVEGTLGLTEPGGIAHSDMKAISVALPEGMTANPSLAEGLGTCSPGDLDEETLGSGPGEGCPEDSKIGSIEVETPIVEQTISGSVYVAEPFDNPFDSLIALYVVLKDPGLGLLIKQAGEVSPDPETGQLITSFDEIAQQPFTRLTFRFREGTRPPLIAPRRCGTHETVAEITPWARPSEPVRRTASFEIDRGPGGGPCPPAGAPPFAPGFSAGSANNAAGQYSPFLMRLTRQDGQQDLTKFGAVLPPGMLARIAGVPWCPEGALAAAKGRDGRDERRSPSCPAASRIGSTLAGTGVGGALTYVPGALYLAGPHNGAPLSVAAITPAVAGPFDVGTVVVRVALDVDPVTGEAIVDGARSDPIPHILAGIPLALRDLRVSADRPAFTLNPTSCRALSTRAVLFGSSANLLDPADDVPLALAAPFRAADCAALGFSPRLGIRLKGKTRRGGHPALRATYVPRPGDANIRRLALTFPRSAFVENAHFRTICTRVQYAAGPGGGALCPPGSIYGQVKAFTPLLDAPLQGPVYLRSSNNLLPDAVFALRGLVDAEVAVRIDSRKGRLRATVQSAPDVPVSRVVVQMRGGKKGLFVNSRPICKGANRARANLIAQSGKRETLRPRFRAQGCGKGKKGKRGKRGKRAR